ncbi:DNA polymerase [Bacillus phage vB_BceM-HSE3]|nr:DNA polymerase [Bacillus phage vB_BceM-HSE3]
MNDFPIDEWDLPVKADLTFGPSMGEEIEVKSLESNDEFTEGTVVLEGFLDEIEYLTNEWKDVYGMVEVLDVPNKKTGEPFTSELVYQRKDELFLPKKAFGRFSGQNRELVVKKVNIKI